MNIVSCFSEDLSDAPEEKLKKLKYECKAHMQVCALLSQLHRHKEALSHAKVAISISHYLVKDIHKLIKYYVDRIQNPSLNFNNEMNNKNKSNENSNTSAKDVNNKDNKGIDTTFKEKLEKKHIDFLYDPQLSLLAKTAIKILPIAEELEKKLVSENLLLKESFDESNVDNSNNIENSTEKQQDNTKTEEFNTTYDKVDMRNLLGYLNQSDWIWSLNIGNIMQISPLTMQDICTTSSIEYELSRELVLEKICFLAVSYFCVSTELRFIVQMKEDASIDPVAKRKESEYFHGKALEVSCSFLPSECPLVNHILMSYQKHHAPSQQVIQENEEYEEDLKVIRPKQGIESNKHQPIVRANRGLSISVTPHDAPLIDYHNQHKTILKQLYEKYIPNAKTIIQQTSQKQTQTTSSQLTTQYPSTSSGASAKYSSMRTTKKTPLVTGNIKDQPKKR